MNRMMFFGLEMSIDAFKSALLSGPDWPTATAAAAATMPDGSDRANAQYAHPCCLLLRCVVLRAEHLRFMRTGR